MSTRHEGQSLLNAMLGKSGKVLPNTSPAGKDAIQQHTEAMKNDYAQLMQDMAVVKLDLESCVQDWCDYEGRVERFNKMLEEMGKMLDGAADDVKSTLAEKKMQCDKYKVQDSGLLILIACGIMLIAIW